MESGMNNGAHVSVLLREAVDALNIRPDGVYVDGTFGRGGHSRAILERLGPQGRLIALDRDLAAQEAGKAIADARFTLVHSGFSSLKERLEELGVSKVDGVLLDIGISSPQIDQAERGFSFRFDGPLDMRMEGAGSDRETAAEVVNTYEERDLSRLISVLGEERYARRIAKAIVKARAKSPFTRTGELAGLIWDLAGGAAQRERIHPATRTFQALRIWVNRELDELAGGLHAAEILLKPGGRLAVVSFHSLEDRMVKRFLGERSGKAVSRSRHLPERTDLPEPSFVEITRGAERPGDAETDANPRSRSARLRAAERTAAPAFAFDATALGLPSLLADDGGR
jgi:16S rRNA (cytosine1402-N4)-methyltransferase